MHLTPCELHTLPDGLVLCHAGISASLLFTSRHSSCNLSGDDCFTASLVQSAECVGDASPPPQAHSHVLSRTPATDAKRIYILSMFSFCLALMAIAWQVFLLVHQSSIAQSWQHLLSPTDSCRLCCCTCVHCCYVCFCLCYVCFFLSACCCFHVYTDAAFRSFEAAPRGSDRAPDEEIWAHLE